MYTSLFLSFCAFIHYLKMPVLLLHSIRTQHCKPWLLEVLPGYEIAMKREKVRERTLNFKLDNNII